MAERVDRVSAVAVGHGRCGVWDGNGRDEFDIKVVTVVERHFVAFATGGVLACFAQV